MFVRTKTVRGLSYHYLVENSWEEGKVRQKVLLYLGDHATVKAAYSFWKREAKKTDPGNRKHAREMVKKLERYLKEG